MPKTQPVPPVDITIERIDVKRLDEIAPLWFALRDHHASLPDMPPKRTAKASWAMRRATYVEWLATPDATLLLATGTEPLGYLMLRIHGDVATWAIGDRVAEVETLSVSAAARGRGVGALLMAAARKRAAEQGARTLSVELAYTNINAKRFYEREGFRSFYISMIAPVATGNDSA